MSTPAEKHALRVSGETALTLVAFIVFFTALLAWAFLFTRPTIEQSARAEKMAVLNQILPTSLYSNDPLTDTLTLPAETALGTTAENPNVGCVIVKDGRLLGVGWTQPGGRPHAETEALRMVESF